MKRNRHFIIVLIICSLALFITTTNNNKVYASNILMENYIHGDLTNNLKIKQINDQDEYLFIPTNNGMYLTNQTTFSIEKKIKFDGIVSDYFLIDNIEDENNSNKDLVVFFSDNSMPSVVVYSLDTLEELWSFNTYMYGYNDQSISIANKSTVFDYAVNDKNLLIVSDYKIYNLDLKSGDLNWSYQHIDNIWSVSFMGDVDNDNVEDIAISVQPTSIMGLSGNLGNVLWEKDIAKPFIVERDNKVLGDVKRNVWDLQFYNDNLIATGEDGYLYKINPVNGEIRSEKSILESIPKLISSSSYMKDNKPIDFSGLSNNGTSTYNLLKTRIINDVNDDGISDLFVTAYEANSYTVYQGLSKFVYIIDGKNFNILAQNEMNINIMTGVNVNNDKVSFSEGQALNIIDLNITDFSNIKTISLENNGGNSTVQYSIVNDNNLYISNKGVHKIDVTDTEKLEVISSIMNVNGYETIYKGDLVYNLYYLKEEFDQNKKYYVAIECNTSSENLWTYELPINNELKDSSFKHYLINNVDADSENEFIYVNSTGNLVVIDYNANVTTKEYTISIENQGELGNITQLIECGDFNNDNFNDIIIVTENSQLIILNSQKLDEIVFSGDLNSIIKNNDDYLTNVYPVFNDKRELYVVGSNSVKLISFSETFETTTLEDNNFNYYNFWDDGSNVTNEYDYDGDGYNDYVIRLNPNEGERNKAVIMFSSDLEVGSVDVGWDFKVYPTTDDLNNDGKFEVIVTTSRDDSDGNWQNVCSIVNPYNAIDGNDDVIFTKVFYEGNDYTNDSKYKPVEIVNDITGDGIKDIVVLMDRWGESYIQVYSINNVNEITKIIPLSIRYIEYEDMIDESIGAPGGYIDSFVVGEKEYLIITMSEQNSNQTYLFDISNNNLEIVATSNGRAGGYHYQDDCLFINFIDQSGNFHRKIDLTAGIIFDNVNNNSTFKNTSLNVEWTGRDDAIAYKLYVNGQVVEITDKTDAELFITDGENTIGLGVVLNDGSEIITNINITGDINTSDDYTVYIYAAGIIVMAYILPLRSGKYRRRGTK